MATVNHHRLLREHKAKVERYYSRALHPKPTLDSPISTRTGVNWKIIRNARIK